MINILKSCSRIDLIEDQHRGGKKIAIRIDNNECVAEPAMTIIEAARANGIDIPAPGYDPRVSPPSNFEVAFVEVEDGDKPKYVSATSTYVHDGMVVHSRSDAPA